MSKTKDLSRFYISILTNMRYGKVCFEYDRNNHADGEFVEAEEAISIIEELEKENDRLRAALEGK